MIQLSVLSATARRHVYLEEVTFLVVSHALAHASTFSLITHLHVGGHAGTSWDIDDGSRSGNYPNNANCMWIFTAQDSSALAKITFTSYDIEAGYDFATVYECYSVVCTESNRNAIYYVDGTGSNLQLLGSTNSLMVIFTTDTSVTQGGFSARFEQYAPSPTPAPTPSPTPIGTTPAPTPPPPLGSLPCIGCSECGNYTGIAWVITDGSGEDNYPNNAHCQWKFITEDTSATTKITLENFAMEEGWDFMHIYDCPDVECANKTLIQVRGPHLTMTSHMFSIHTTICAPSSGLTT